ncbi:hypothetical protein C3432_19550 [Citrobacter amalonaticus]|uniref:Uncharacterized protein n=1 Tax=Citrobacter amalonaticus TaxID=35703 RepID=A0A2S4RXS8_CITAM|nr:hypothetical protein C3432_19550 [Citrobacter amalonaticus]POT74482.1 hypothetical protein C3436_17190 [Citrobacter amalonaticus]POU65281.1 hypothetical protein C3430_13930 [Citrobacter amalonaticus]POV04116.1 hypothetical protein C3424_18870 [Citrobacter amalonaticus]
MKTPKIVTKTQDIYFKNKEIKNEAQKNPICFLLKKQFKTPIKNKYKEYKTIKIFINRTTMMT